MTTTMRPPARRRPPRRTFVGRLGDLLSDSTLDQVAAWVADDEPDRTLAVYVTDEAGSILGIVRVAIEGTGDDGHDAIHAIIAASDAVAERGLDWPEGYSHGHGPPEPEPVAEGGAIRCGEPGCPGNAGRGLPPARHTCALGRDLYPNS